MEAKVIIVTVVKSNKSENNVWMVAITGEEQGRTRPGVLQESLQGHAFRFHVEEADRIPYRGCIPQGSLRGNS